MESQGGRSSLHALLEVDRELDPAKLLKIGTESSENSPNRAKISSFGRQTAEVGLERIGYYVPDLLQVTDLPAPAFSVRTDRRAKAGRGA